MKWYIRRCNIYSPRPIYHSKVQPVITSTPKRRIRLVFEHFNSYVVSSNPHPLAPTADAAPPCDTIPSDIVSQVGASLGTKGNMALVSTSYVTVLQPPRIPPDSNQRTKPNLTPIHAVYETALVPTPAQTHSPHSCPSPAATRAQLHSDQLKVPWGCPSHTPTVSNLTLLSHERITAMQSMKSPPLTGGQVCWLLSSHDFRMHVGFQQTPNSRDNKRWDVCFQPAQR